MQPLSFPEKKCYATKNKALEVLHTVNFHYWQPLNYLTSCTFFAFPRHHQMAKKSLPKYQQQLILWLKTKSKQTNRNQSNIMILVQQTGKLNASVIQWFAWAVPVPTLPLLQTFSPVAECDTQGQRGAAMCDMAGHWLQQPLSHMVAPVINAADCDAQLEHSPLKGKKPQSVCL